MNINYDQLVNRNRFFIPYRTQDEIRNMKVLIAGCGVGSTLVDILVRVGFTKFILFDGDDVDVTNLNRQHFFSGHVGMNKALVTKSMIEAVNPDAEIVAYPRFITADDDLDSFISGVDFVINTVDFNDVVFLLEESARKNGKTTISSFNAGFGSYVWVFTPESISLREMLGNPEEKLIFSEIIVRLMPYFPDYLREIIEENIHEYKKMLDNEIPIPQLGVAVFLSSTLITSILIRLIQDLPVKVAPQLNFIDIFNILE